MTLFSQDLQTPGAGPETPGGPFEPPRRPQPPQHLVRRTRRRLFWWSLPIVLVILAIAWKLVSLQLTTDGAKDDFDAGDYEGSADRSGSLLVANLIEPWIPYYNRGTALATFQNYTPATDDLGEALTRAPASERCMVRVNLALAWEQQGDAYRGAGYEEGAIRLYETSLAVIRDGAADGCQTDESSRSLEQRDTLQTADERVQAKIDQQSPQIVPQPGQGDAPDEGSSGENDPSAEEKLQERGDQAAEEKAQQDAEERGRNGGGSTTDKPW